MQMFPLLSAMCDMVFRKSSKLPFSRPNKIKDRQQVPPSHQVRTTNTYGNFKPNKPKGQLNFLEVKILGWFTIICYTLQNALLDHTLY